MKFEHLLSDINGFGRFQIMIIIISFVARFTLPCHFMLGNFIAAVPSHRCDLSTLDDEGIFENLTQEQRLTVTIPVQEDGTPSSCKMFPEPQFHLLSNSNGSDLATVPCQNGWVYDNSTFKSTLATEWDLVCDQKGKNKATATIFFLGVMFGAMTFGSLSDRFGRKTMLLVSYISGMLFGVASAFSTSFIMFAVLRFFTGFGITGIVIISSVLSVEWVDIEHRKLVGVIDSLSWTFGNSMIPAIAYCVNDWRQLTIVVTSPLVLALLTWRWIPESARWLIANGKFEKANFYLQQCAQINQKQEFASKITPETLSSIIVTERKDRTYSYLDLVRTPKMRRLALLTGIVWQNGMGYNSSMGRLGVSLAPLILLLDEVWRDLPQVLLCSIALLASLVARMLPETRDRCLPETIQDIEDGQTGKSLAGSQVVETTEIPLKSKANDEGEN
ncbi:solute carrier family 22 member 7-like isoform X2 [Oncorhynchus mykiss]|uniref:solute carrier family 22 member 7-like isoform X2 n=1 Tax=Oncorhynchus mykiss TaxID=8022 RepID=UPI000B4EF38B|nr:solute carrier family 22 member 7-like isoform X2 [Oncorhynchus mykiss]